MIQLSVMNVWFVKWLKWSSRTSWMNPPQDIRCFAKLHPYVVSFQCYVKGRACSSSSVANLATLSLHILATIQSLLATFSAALEDFCETTLCYSLISSGWDDLLLWRGRALTICLSVLLLLQQSVLAALYSSEGSVMEVRSSGRCSDVFGRADWMIEFFLGRRPQLSSWERWWSKQEIRRRLDRPIWLPGRWVPVRPPSASGSFGGPVGRRRTQPMKDADPELRESLCLALTLWLAWGERTTTSKQDLIV